MNARSRRVRIWLPIALAIALAFFAGAVVARADVATDAAAVPSDTVTATSTVTTTATVTFDSTGGSAIDAQVVDVGSLAATPVPDPVRTGHTFAGWFSDAGLTTPWDFSAETVAGDMTLYAAWTINSYAVTFDSHGGSAVASQSVDYGGHVTRPADPTRTGYTFTGWFTSALLTTPWDFATATIASDTTLHAGWSINTYAVTFSSNGGSAVSAQSVTYGGLVTKPADPTRTGYTFAGWYADAGLTTAWNFATRTISGDTTLYAKWSINSYQVIFHSNGGSAIANQTVAYGSLVTTPTPPTRTGYTFAGWYADSGLTTTWNFSADHVGAADTDLYAKWTINRYAVSFQSNGGSAVATQSVAFGSLVTVPATPLRAGYTFAGWYADAALTTPWDFPTRTVAADTTLYAAWTTNSYRVTFHSNGGTAVLGQTLAFGSLVTRPSTPTRTGYTFAGWYADAALTTAWDFASGLVGPADMDLYAKWTVNVYAITFDTTGGSAVAGQSVAYGSLVTSPTAPSKTGYTFAGWYADSDLTTPWSIASRTVTGDATLYAKWAINSYRVTFHSNGGTPIADETLDFGSAIVRPADPERTGYHFAGWYSDDALTTLWDFSAGRVGAADMDLYAKWTLNDYLVGFVSNGGTSVDTATVSFDSLVSAPADPTRVGHTFAGWYADAALTTPWDFSAEKVSGDMMLYAKWTINSYQVVFRSNGGSAVATQTLTFGSPVTRPTNPVRTGYLFAGWFANSALTTPWDFTNGRLGAADMILYAKWATTYKITAYAGTGGTLSVKGVRVVAKGSSLTVYVTPASGWGIGSVKVDGVSKGALKSYTFTTIGANHTISATFKRLTTTSLSASASSVKRGGYVTLYGRLRSNVTSFSNCYLRFEVRLPGSTTFILLKTVKLSSTGRASYRYQVLNTGTRYHRVRYLGNSTFLPAPLQAPLALKVQ